MKRTAVGNQQCVESGADLGEQLTSGILNSIRWTKHPGRARGAASERSGSPRRLWTRRGSRRSARTSTPWLLPSWCWCCWLSASLCGWPGGEERLEGHEQQRRPITSRWFGDGCGTSLRDGPSVGGWAGGWGWGCDFGCCCASVHSHSTSRGLR